MSDHEENAATDYPHGRGYGHDYMRGGEVFGGYGYSSREEYERSRGELHRDTPPRPASTSGDDRSPSETS